MFAPPKAVTPLRVLKVRPGRRLELPDDVATEEPLQLMVAGPGAAAVPLAVTMRTPGHDFELAAGFVFTEGVALASEIRSVDYCEAASADPVARWNHVAIRLTRPHSPDAQPRTFAASASCGTCGKTSIDELAVACGEVPTGGSWRTSSITGAVGCLRGAQKSFDRTGGLHAAGLFDRDGELRVVREDVGRHNAVDKVIGATLLDPEHFGTARGDYGLVVSGRVSFEIVQKAAVAGLPLLAAVSAPSSLAVETAKRLGVTLAAFVRGDSFNVYSHDERLTYTD